MGSVDSLQRLVIRQEIHDRLLDYWREIDENAGRQAGAFWTENAVWEAPARTFNGRSEIQGFFDWRLTRGDRLALHTVANFKATVESETRASALWYLLLYAADGKPVLPSEPPVEVAAISDRWVREDGLWLCEHRKFRTLFQGRGVISGPAATEKR